MTTTRASHIQKPDLSELQATCQCTSRAYRAHTISYDVSFRSPVKRSTVPFQRGPPSIFIFLSIYTYATTRGCISRSDAAPPAFEKCVSSFSAPTASASNIIRLFCHIQVSFYSCHSTDQHQHKRSYDSLSTSFLDKARNSISILRLPVNAVS